MRPQDVAEAATCLPWLAPCATSLVQLSQSAGLSRWSELRTDPGCVLLLARCGPVTPSVSDFSLSTLRQPAILQGALRLLDQPAAVAWSQPVLRPVYQASLAYAEMATRLAEKTGRVEPATAWAAGLLAPLGWLAVAAVAPAAIEPCLQQPDAVHQQACWGLDQAAIGRRLVRRWQLPAWLGAVVGHLSLPVEVAQDLGAEADLFCLVQLAVSLVQRQQPALALAIGANPLELAARWGLATEELDRWAAGRRVPSGTERPWTPPATHPLLRDVLQLAEENRRLSEAPVLAQLESDLDELHGALAQQRDSETRRLQTQKLATLAEFAGGAGHEINNPLAVISGQAQYLLKQLRLADWKLQSAEGDPPGETTTSSAGPLPGQTAAFEKGLTTIVNQTQRIHDILQQLMQFARPARPQKRLVDLGGLLREVVAAQAPLAAQKQVRLVCPDLDLPLTLNVDPKQLRLALVCLLRNAIEAAPPEGWAGVRVQQPAANSVEVVVEDSGAGPPAHHREHLFDPFFSGRQAGRGRGLGLPTAWRLAREHGGDVVFDERSEKVTRFTLRLPRETTWSIAPDTASADVPEKLAESA